VKTFLYQSSHLEGTVNSIETIQLSVTIFVISHFLFQSFSIIAQENSSGTFTTTFSIGSVIFHSSFSLNTTFGAQT
jgi:hypothetical protein